MDTEVNPELLSIIEKLSSNPKDIDREKLYQFLMTYTTINTVEIRLIGFILRSMLDFAEKSICSFSIDEILTIIYSNVCLSFFPFEYDITKYSRMTNNPVTLHIINEFQTYKTPK